MVGVAQREAVGVHQRHEHLELRVQLLAVDALLAATGEQHLKPRRKAHQPLRGDGLRAVQPRDLRSGHGPILCEH